MKRGSIELARRLCVEIAGFADPEDFEGNDYGSVDVAEILSAEVVRLRKELDAAISSRCNYPQADEMNKEPNDREAVECRDFTRGYFCAVGVLLREEGAVTTQVRDLFNQGGNAELADECDKVLFREYGLLLAKTTKQ